MKRPVVVLLSAALLLALPGIAFAASRFYRGPAGPGRNADIEITAKLAAARPHKPTKLTRVEWANIPAACGRYAPSATSGFYPEDVPVTRSGTFRDSAKLNRGRVTVTLSGSFTSHPTAVSGTIRIKGAIPGCGTGDTGVVRWHAKPPPPVRR